MVKQMKAQSKPLLMPLWEQWWQALHAYYVRVDQPPLLCDAAYDTLKKELLAIKNPRLDDAWRDDCVQVVPAAQAPFETMAHSTPMLSLANVYCVQALRDWGNGLERSMEKEEQIGFLAELKIDGIALALYYKNGQLVRALTRGDGVNGEEVTPNAKTLGNLPFTLKQSITLEVRGEVYLPLAQFAKQNQQRVRNAENPYKNPRNAAAGALRMLDSAQTAQRGLEIALYACGNGEEGLPDCHHGEEVLRALENLGLPVINPRIQAKGIEEICNFYLHWQSQRHTLPFQIDGVVVKVLSLATRQKLGGTSKSPRWAVAAKFSTEQAESVLLGVEVGVGRTGKIAPVALLEPVELLGTTVARASLHHYGYIRKLGLRTGDVVRIEKGGDVIPKVVGRVEVPSMLVPPTHCPSCAGALTPMTEKGDLYCNNLACEQQHAARIFYFVSRKAMDIETIGPELLRQLLNKRIITSFADLYQLDAEKLQGLPGVGEKRIGNLLAGIERSKTRPLHRFLAALGIRHLGEQASRALAEHYGSFAALHGACIQPPAILATELPLKRKDALLGFFADKKKVSSAQTRLQRFQAEPFAYFMCTQAQIPHHHAQKIVAHYTHFKALQEAYHQGKMPQPIEGVGSDIRRKLSLLFGSDANLKKASDALKLSQQQPFAYFLCSLGIPQVGKQAAQQLAQTYHDFNSLYVACQNGVLRLQQILPIGPETAASVCDYFMDESQLKLALQCLELGVTPVSPAAKTAKASVLQGKRVVITGTLSQPRHLWIERLTQAGVRVSGSISSHTNYLLAGEKAGLKKTHAQTLGVDIVNEAQMETLLRDKSNANPNLGGEPRQVQHKSKRKCHSKTK